MADGNSGNTNGGKSHSVSDSSSSSGGEYVEARGEFSVRQCKDARLKNAEGMGRVRKDTNRWKQIWRTIITPIGQTRKVTPPKKSRKCTSMQQEFVTTINGEANSG